MQVFKVFFKVIKKNLAVLSIYLFIFIAIAFFMTKSGTSTVATNFTESKDSDLVKGFISYINGNSKIISIKDDSQALQDALFFRKVEYILTIPEGFTDDFMVGKDVKLQKISVPDSTSATYMDVLIDNYLNTARLYVKNLSGITQADLVKKVSVDYSVEAGVTMQTKASDNKVNPYLASFFNFSAYSTLAILILSVCTFMLVFNKTDLRKRNLCSPISLKSINAQILFANFLFALLVCAIILICAYALFGQQLFSTSGLLLTINLLIFMLAALSLSFLIASFVKNRNAQSAAANTVALGMSFISGVFVPQSILGDTVKTIASFTPAYWFVKANDTIGSIVSFNTDNLSVIFNCYLIQLGFAIGLVALTFILTRQKRSEAKIKKINN